MSAPRRVLLAPAGSPEIGGGHVLRAIALADALAARGGAPTLATNAYGVSLARRFGGAARIHPLADDGGADALAEAVTELAAEVLVLDDYAADARTVEALSGTWPRVAVIDDLADRPYACDLLVDPGHGRAAADYAGLVPGHCRVLTGPSYALLRPGFERSGGPFVTSPAVSRVFVSLGLGDVAAVTERVVVRLRALDPRLRIDVALAADAPSLARLREQARTDDRLTLHVDARDVAELMRAADVAVGAGGASTWERCALGLPSLAVIVADNQRRVVRALEADGVLLACVLEEPGFGHAFDDAWRRLQDRELRVVFSARSAALCDGRGAGRVADAILRL